MSATYESLNGTCNNSLRGVQVYATLAAMESRFSCKTVAASVAAGMTPSIPDRIIKPSNSTANLRKLNIISVILHAMGAGVRPRGQFTDSNQEPIRRFVYSSTDAELLVQVYPRAYLLGASSSCIPTVCKTGRSINAQLLAVAARR